MIWALYAIMAAFSQATDQVFAKKALKTLDDVSVYFGKYFFAMIFGIILLFFILFLKHHIYKN